jgi:hypothetical protein
MFDEVLGCKGCVTSVEVYWDHSMQMVNVASMAIVLLCCYQAKCCKRM